MTGAIAVELHAHSSEWAALADTESARLRDALGGVLVTVHHIGSTSILGIMAKPIIDLIPIVTNLGASVVNFIIDASESYLPSLFGPRTFLECG